MVEANMLMNQKKPDDIVYGVTILLLRDETVDLAGETVSDKGVFKLNEDKAYRLICDIKHKLELNRLSRLFVSADKNEADEEDYPEDEG